MRQRIKHRERQASSKRYRQQRHCRVAQALRALGHVQPAVFDVRPDAIGGTHFLGGKHPLQQKVSLSQNCGPVWFANIPSCTSRIAVWTKASVANPKPLPSVGNPAASLSESGRNFEPLATFLRGDNVAHQLSVGRDHKEVAPLRDGRDTP